MRILFVALLLISTRAFAWGQLGHKFVAQYGSELVDAKTLANCRVTVDQLVAHTNDPDQVWRNQRWAHPSEPRMHYFHIDKQPGDWRTRTTAKDPTQGQLVYRIVAWKAEAEKLRKERKWDELAEHLYGLSHYTGDLTQPMHLMHDYDGYEAGLSGIHSQFETKMLNRYEDEVRVGVRIRITNEKIPQLWQNVEFKNLIFDTAVQNGAKLERLYSSAHPALQHNRRGQRFVKAILWKETGQLAMDQLALGARLWAFTLNSICR